MRRWDSIRRPATVLAIFAVAMFCVQDVSAAPFSSDLRARVQERGTVRVLARLPVARAQTTLPGSGAGDRGRKVAIRSARGRLEADLGETAWRVVQSYDAVPWVALEVGAEALDRLEESDSATVVVEDRKEKILLGESAPLLQADEAYAAGFDGEGWTVVVVDTGVEGSHDFLEGKVVGEACFSTNGSCPNGETEQFGAGAGATCDFSETACGHGTHVAGVISGDGQNVDGIAREASLISIQVFSEFTGEDCEDDEEDPCAKTYTSDTAKALDYVYSLRNTFKIAAVNLSLGAGRYSSEAECDAEDSARKEIVDRLRSVGIATVAAAGNEAAVDALTSPACISSVVSVGATTDDDEIASFSNSASFLDLLAPGTAILSSIPGGSAGAEISGTSQAAPHVAAAFALLGQGMGVGDVDRALDALSSTGVPVLDSRNGLVRPRIRILDALNSLPISGFSSSGLQVTPDGKQTLVSKDVGAERWAIALNAADGTVTGNVFMADGGEPSFVWCSWVSDDGNSDAYEREIIFDCSGARACLGPSCSADQWSKLATVTLPGSFFLPPLATASLVGPAATPGGTAAAIPTGVQITPDEKRTLVSKDVGDDRWAISRSEDDQTVTGNVFTPGQEPTFIWCERVGDNGNPDPAALQITYSCSSASRCVREPCGGSQWEYLQEVNVPGWFFLP